MKSLNIIFNAQVSKDSMGGGDKIVIELAKKLTTTYKLEVKYLGCPDGLEMVRLNDSTVPFLLINSIKTKRFGLIVSYLLRILLSFKLFFKTLKISGYVLSSSDFLPDTLVGFFLKLKNKDLIWLANMFLQARNPFKGEINFSVSNVLYFFSQQISIELYKLNCSQVYVLSKQDKDYLIKRGLSSTKVSLISGGVNLADFKKVKVSKILYDGCFIGRFHPQKGLDTLIKVWAGVVKVVPEAKLAIIGWGDTQQVESLKNLISSFKLNNNIILLGFKDGAEKIKVLKSSKVLLFPSTFESWGVVIAESLASGVPVVSFSLPQIKKNFKNGVLWVNCFDHKKFTKQVLSLIQNPLLRSDLSNQALNFSKELSWDFCVNKFFNSFPK